MAALLSVKDPISYADLARICDTHPSTITRWVQCEFLPCARVIRRSRRTGRATRLGWSRAEIEAWLSKFPAARALTARTAVLEANTKFTG
jgi:predicted DNA-binding transcriptional regulator AlpA